MVSVEGKLGKDAKDEQSLKAISPIEVSVAGKLGRDCNDEQPLNAI